VRLNVTDIVAYGSAGGSFRYGMCLNKNTSHTHTCKWCKYAVSRGGQVPCGD